MHSIDKNIYRSIIELFTAGPFVDMAMSEIWTQIYNPKFYLVILFYSSGAIKCNFD